MRWPWERTPEEKVLNRRETDLLILKIDQVMGRLHETLDAAEAEIKEDLRG